jgi:5'-3' exonuclease
VDGVAGAGKMNQQKERRYEYKPYFNTNVFTPGTQFLDNMTKYVDWYIRRQITTCPDWRHLKVIFSNEKVPGEGEHKIMKYIKKYTSMDMNIYIVGCDADLIMLTLLLPHRNVYIARNKDYISISDFKTDLFGRFGSTDISIIYDFVFLFTMVGNDFLPACTFNFDSILRTHENVFKERGNILQKQGGHFLLQRPTFKAFLEKMISNTPMYHNKYFLVREDVARQYLDGMFWNITYYVHDIPDWRWFFKYKFAPSITDILGVIDDYEIPSFFKNEPMDPFMQLFILLPEKDKYLLPDALQVPIRLKSVSLSNLAEYEDIYKNHEPMFSPNEKKRNRLGKTFLYKHGGAGGSTFFSYYGNILDCAADISYEF